MLAFLPSLPQGALILALPTLTEDAALLDKVRQRDCVLALGELGSRVPALLQAGWPIRYWLPEPSDHLALLHPLARQLGLRRLNRTGAVGQGDVLKQREPY